MGWARLLVLVAVIGAVAFGLLLGYLAYTNDSFPTQEKPFAEYASVVATRFNGTELYYKVQWTTSGNFTPLFAQVTSPSSDAANTPVCGLGITSIVKGGTFEMPFSISTPSTALSSVDLAIAVRSNVNTTEFTIVYHLDQVTAQPGNIGPPGYSCEQPQGSDM